MASIDEAYTLPLTQTVHKEKFKSDSDILRGSYKTYINKTNTYKRDTANINLNSELRYYQLKDHSLSNSKDD